MPMPDTNYPFSKIFKYRTMLEGPLSFHRKEAPGLSVGGQNCHLGQLWGQNCNPRIALEGFLLSLHRQPSMAIHATGPDFFFPHSPLHPAISFLPLQTIISFLPLQTNHHGEKPTQVPHPPRAPMMTNPMGPTTATVLRPLRPRAPRGVAREGHRRL